MAHENRIIRTADLRREEALHTRHPLKPEGSDVYVHMLAMKSGLARLGVGLSLLPPGNASFLPHAHASQEEFVFILEGKGAAVFDDEEHPVGPGDFIAYPCDGVAHQLRNTGDVDLVYLMAGEQSPLDVVRFPSVGKLGVFTADGVTLFDEKGGTKLSFDDYVAPDE